MGLRRDQKREQKTSKDTQWTQLENNHEDISREDGKETAKAGYGEGPEERRRETRSGKEQQRSQKAPSNYS